MATQTIAFAGTPQFAVPTLRGLIAAGFTVPVVLTQPDRPAGRGRGLRASAVKMAARESDLMVLQPAALRDRQILASFPAPDLLVVVAYGLILPEWLLRWPRLGAVNVHASVLPRWRGAAPIQHALLAGDETTGVSIMQMDAGLDTGPIFASSTVRVGTRTTAAELHDQLAQLGADTLIGTLPGILTASLAAVPQRDRDASYAPKLAKSDAPIDWRRSARALDRQVRALNPWPVAEGTLIGGDRLRIWEAFPDDEPTDTAPGTVERTDAPGIVVATGAGTLRLTIVQAAGGRAISAAAYVAAHPLAGRAFVC